MKRLIYFVALVLCFSLTSCWVLVDTDTPLSSELSEKYAFYKNSAAAIRSGCNVSPEEADAIFLVLVENCGANSEITVTPYANKPYEVKWSSKTYTMTLDGSTVASVLDGENQIYPATAAAALPEETEEAPEESTETAPDVSHRTGEEIVGISDKDIADLKKKIVVMDVPNDVTENWKYITLSENTDFIEYALSYYNSYFGNDKEIHAVVNFANNTTTKISVFGEKLEITVHDYVDGEEHDAKQLFSGTPLADYIIYIDNGDIEKVVEE